jgi:hypothetical protein
VPTRRSFAQSRRLDMYIRGEEYQELETCVGDLYRQRGKEAERPALSSHCGWRRLILLVGMRRDPWRQRWVWGNSGWEFDSATTASIVCWNFHDATQVNLGAGSDPVEEFIGSILVPHGSMKFEMPGQSGRTIVRGGLEQNFAGAEIYNDLFEPHPHDPHCQLVPLPHCVGRNLPNILPRLPPNIRLLITSRLPPNILPWLPPNFLPRLPPNFRLLIPPSCRLIFPPRSQFLMIPTTCRLFTNEQQHLETETAHPVYTPPYFISPSTPSSKIVGVTHPYGNPILICEKNCVNVGFGMTNQL